MYEKLKNIIDPRTISYSLRNEIKNITNYMDSSISISERIFVLLNGDQNICSRGNNKKFHSFKNGYVFCGRNCECAKEKIKQTNLERYGVEHAAQNSEVKERTKQTNINKYGVEYPIQNSEVKEKQKHTNIEKYGFISSSQNSEVKEK